MNADGTNEQNLFEVPDMVEEITCSPVGEKIAYQAEKLTISNYDGAQKTVFPTSAQYFDWSPDAARIVYSTGRKLYVTNADGTGTAQQIATSAEAVAWRVGSKIVFEDSFYNKIYAMDPASSSKEAIANISQKPQITQSIRVIFRGQGDQVQSVKIDGSDNQVLFGSYSLTTLKLSFDNTKIVGGDLITGGGSWIGGIWIVNIDGSGEKRLR